MAKLPSKGTPKRMAKSGKGKTLFSNNASPSTTAPRAPGPAGKGGNWRGGIPQFSQAYGMKGMASGGQGSANTSHTRTPATQGGSTANMGDATPTTGHNRPRGYGDGKNAKKGILATGSTPLSRTGSSNKKKNPAAQVTGLFGF